MAGALLIVGCGEIGRATGLALAGRGWQVTGLRRHGGSLPAPLEALSADVTDPASLQCLDGKVFSQVLITLTPGEFSEQRYRSVYCDGVANVLERLARHPPRRLLFASSTSVYHQNDGGWVDERSPTVPGSFSGRVMLEAERLLAGSGLPVTAVRFGGIYGPGRDRLLQRVRAGHLVGADCPFYSNRIHSADCAGFLVHLLEAEARGEALADCYLAVDGHPARLREVCEWLARSSGLDPSTMGGEAPPVRGGSKRCRNHAMLATGYQLRYPDYRAGYAELL